MCRSVGLQRAAGEQQIEFLNDAFISYSGANREFARQLEHLIENYSAPRQLGLGQRKLRVFRYEGDMTGTDYFAAIEKHLDESRCLIVLCSIEARQSTFVNDEISRFVKKAGPMRTVIPLLLSGAPNNEARDEAEKAFPEALYKAAQMPLALNYRGIEAHRKRLDRPPFESEWYTLLANLLNVSRDDIEQRDRARRVRRLKIATAASCTIAALLLGLTAVSVIQRNAAVSARYATEARQATLLADTAARDGERVRALILAKYALDLTQRASPRRACPQSGNTDPSTHRRFTGSGAGGLGKILRHG